MEKKASDCPILFDEMGLLVISKPDGVLSHPNPGQKGKGPRCAFQGPYDVKDRRFDTPDGPVWLLHRLDQDTSGILLAARDKKMAATCRQLFEEGKIKKMYTALLAGDLKPPVGQWKDHLVSDRRGGRVRTQVLSGYPFNARLNYWRRQFFPTQRLSLVDIELITGKTHQIRVQSAWRRHPVIGDDIYGHFALNKMLRRDFGLKRMFLHASESEIPLPEKTLLIQAPLPDALAETLSCLI